MSQHALVSGENKGASASEIRAHNTPDDPIKCSLDLSATIKHYDNPG